MMPIITKFEDLEGKTIRKVETCSDELYIVFTNDTFAVVKGEEERRDCGVEMKLLEKATYAYRLVELGVMTVEEQEAERQVQIAQWAEDAKKREIEDLKRLKAKYPND